jgi:hypothetical protein
MAVCAGGGLLQSARRSPPDQTSEGVVMKTLIKVVKRRSEDKRDNKATAVPEKPLLTTETIIKSWIIESRERRQAAMSQLHSSIGWKALGGAARG